MTSAKSARRPHHWRRDLIELAALFTAVAVADAIANLIGHQPDGPYLLVASAVALTATATFHTWWARRHSHAPPPTADGLGADHDSSEDRSTHRLTSATRTGTTTGAVAPVTAPAAAGPALSAGETVLWRMRTTVRDTPGSLAALCIALARHRVDILTLQTHPLAEGTVDEFLLRAPSMLQAQQLSRAISAAGGSSTWIERADAHDLVDAPTRILGLATRTALDAAELPLALRQLLGRCTIHSLPAVSISGRATGETAPVEGVLEETVMRLRDPSGGAITIERPYLPFTPTEFARARALVELDARLGPRVPGSEHVLTLPEGNEITVRRADQSDLAAARAMHDRCSDQTLRLRYHGPVHDADRYLDHLLSPRFGRTLAVQTASGRLVALGHLLWDGDETEVALLVEDDWQRRGIGSELLGRLVTLAIEAGCESVYAVTQASNTGMVAAMRALALPLDYQIEEGTLVITARLEATPVRSLPPYEQAGR
ncbi:MULTISPECIES: GNAT family N-acetyltransferase [unclassified Streptomyces]|uniref:GNAT family N-acetyltransferase n=1 Tax=unclassified Streptomyces TaxID=2593676 RepID=UPI002DDB8DF6|nr:MULTISPECIES: GNAT family N-acetyltransferase [unclassified Streptomyces]WSC42070.1 GNAT family N-acetyltransferase [Streptomyces sp. NBC_01763]WSC50407.1 GNAT family N-acetyltransferase [Streptomyces sp. NBC_01762]WSC59078.1 GNAT family N-acetyltransferase [Streptomyces sp. NBC_01761]WSD30009.1 GNAT family N-acetyltransferase [Streptomyces sp. NBC_01751]WSJ56406.1 GNAT family N-acetyltransferase [Streptomyces sp. NBC_01318]